MAVGKKGFFFTITAIMLLIALALLISVQVNYEPKDHTILRTRTSTMNDFVKTVRSDLQRGLYITSFRSVLSMEQYISTYGVFLNSSDTQFKSAILSGKINNVSMGLVQNSTFPDWAQSIKLKARDIGLVANISIDGVSVGHQDRWNLVVSSNITVNITDEQNTAVWRVNQTVTSIIPIIGLEDPVFTVNSNGKIIRIINSTPYDGKYVQGTNTSNLTSHIDGYFYTNGTGPSFLMRFEGNYSNSTFGIESFVNVPQLDSYDLPQYKRSMIDYVYFANTSTDAIYVVNSTYTSWLVIDNAHRSRYQVANYSYLSP